MLFAFLYRNWLNKQAKKYPNADSLKQNELNKLNSQIDSINKDLLEAKCKHLNEIMEENLYPLNAKKKKFMGNITWLHLVKFLN